MTYQVVRYNRVLFEGSRKKCLENALFLEILTGCENLQIWRKDVREGLNRGFIC